MGFVSKISFILQRKAHRSMYVIETHILESVVSHQNYPCATS